MAKGGGVSGEKRCEGREKWEMKRNKEEKHAESTKGEKKKKEKKWEMKNWGKIFGKKKKMRGELVLYSFFFFDKAI